MTSRTASSRLRNQSMILSKCSRDCSAGQGIIPTHTRNGIREERFAKFVKCVRLGYRTKAAPQTTRYKDIRMHTVKTVSAFGVNDAHAVDEGGLTTSLLDVAFLKLAKAVPRCQHQGFLGRGSLQE